ncbi:opioid growth factor receptor isoform X1 [Lissotriton helveticus]
MQGEKHWHCRYDSTWEGEGEEEEEEEERPEERPKGQGKNTHVKKNTQRMNEGTFRQRNMRAAQDMQNYRHGYPDLEDEDEDSADMPNLRFYLNQDRFQPNGVLIEELLTKWHKNYKILEQSHSYIQWLFPLREAGMNWSATPLTKKELEVFKENAEVKERFVRAYKLMLDFYGIELVDEQTGKLVRAQHYDVCFQNLNWHSHNNLRITRILKCLGEMGYEHFQVKLVKFFLKETLKERTLPSVKQSVLDYFLFTVRDRQERRKLVHYAWKHYQPQDRFVWGPHEKLKRFKVHRKLPKQGSNPSVVSQANLTESGAGSTDIEGGLAQTRVEVVDENASSNNSHLEFESETVSEKKSILESSEGAASEEGQAKPDPRPTESPESSAVPIVRAASEVEDARNSGVGDAEHQDSGEEQPHDHSGTEALKEGKKRKLPGMEPEGVAETLQRPLVHETNPPKHLEESEKLKSDSLNTESSQATNRDDAPLPATKKKKVDELETEHLRSEEDSSPSKSPTDDDGSGQVQHPACKTKETFHTAQLVEGESLSMPSNNPASLPSESHHIKDDFSENKQKIAQSTDESKCVQSCDSQHTASIPPQGKTQESNPKTQDLENLEEGHNMEELTEQTKNIIVFPVVDEKPPEKDLLGEAQADNQGKVFRVCSEKTGEDLAPETDNPESDPKAAHTVCPTPQLGSLISQMGSAALNGEQDPELGSNESSSDGRKLKEYCDIPAPDNVTDENRKDGNDGRVEHGKSLLHQDSNTIHSPLNVMETKSMPQLGNSKPAAASDSVEEIMDGNKHDGSQTTEASVEVKQVFRTTKVKDAVNEVKTQVETVDCSIVQTDVAVKDYKGLSEKEGLKSTQTAEKANGLTGHLDSQPQQVADVLGEASEAAGLPLEKKL